MMFLVCDQQLLMKITLKKTYFFLKSAFKFLTYSLNILMIFFMLQTTLNETEVFLFLLRDGFKIHRGDERCFQDDS